MIGFYINLKTQSHMVSWFGGGGWGGGENKIGNGDSSRWLTTRLELYTYIHTTNSRLQLVAH